jgi:hypothetical protein
MGQRNIKKHMDPNGLNMFKPTKKTIKDHTEDAEPHFFQNGPQTAAAMATPMRR